MTCLQKRLLAGLVVVFTFLTCTEDASAAFRRRTHYGRRGRTAYRGFGYRPFIYADAGSYMRGVANVIDAQGRYMMNTQKTYLLKEKVRAAKLDNRRKLFDQYMYEKANTPTLEEQREYRRKQEYWRSWNNPPMTEIWSGKALNDLLTAYQKIQSEKGLQGHEVALDPNIMRHVNFTTGTTRGSVGVLQTGPNLRWPLPLQRSPFKKERETINALAPQVVNKVIAGNLDVETFDKLDNSVDRLRQTLRDNVSQMHSTDYIQSLRFVNELRNAMSNLQSPQAANHFNGKLSVKAYNVGELVQQMTTKGLKFAPVTVGYENYYTALQRAMVTYGSDFPFEDLRSLRTKFYSKTTPAPKSPSSKN